MSGADVRSPDRTAPTESRAQRLLVVLGIVVVAFNLRPAAVSVGPVLDEVTQGLGMSSTTAGVLTTLPVVAFAVVGAAAPWLARTVGLHRVTLVALVAVVVGLGVRARISDVPLFLVLSLLALSGMATANVLLPSLVKLHFPERVGLMTSVYTTALAVGLTSASVLTVPVADHFGSWRWGLFAWALTAVVAALPWLALVAPRPGPAGPSPGGSRWAQVARTRLGWSLALFFGLQSLQAYSVFGWFAKIYRDAGFSAGTAGLLLGVITAMGIPLSFWLPALGGPDAHPDVAGGRAGRPATRSATSACCWPRSAGPGCGRCSSGAGSAVFPVTLALIGLRARTSEGTAALSGFTQSVGYLLATVGPFGMGLLYDLSGAWTVPLLALTVLLLPQLALGFVIARPAYIEDQVSSAP